MKQRSTIDWKNPGPAPSSFMEVTLPGIPDGPGVVTSDAFTIVGKPRSKKGYGIWLVALIYYVREACIRFPAFREELAEMLIMLPSNQPRGE